MSVRSGTPEVWVCDARGSNQLQLTFSGGWNPAWSPDGDRIAFASDKEGNFDVFVIGASGAGLKQVTTDPASDRLPNWSADGKWIYFTSERGDAPRVWKTPAGGGEAVLTQRPGNALNSRDGRHVYYLEDGSIRRARPEGGDETLIVDLPVNVTSFAVVEEGIYFTAGRTLQFRDFATGQTRKTAVLEAALNQGLTVSPDGRSILYMRQERSGADLRLVENFR